MELKIPVAQSATGCAASRLQYSVAESDEEAVIRQGVEVGRPSEMYVRATHGGQRIKNVRVGGYAVEVLRGIVTFWRVDR